MDQIIKKHFAIPQNRLEALNFMLKVLDEEFYLCHCLDKYIDITLNRDVEVTGILHKEIGGELKLHELIPELTHPFLLLPKAKREPNGEFWNVWAKPLKILYRQLITETADDASYQARRIHIQNAIKKIQSYEI